MSHAKKLFISGTMRTGGSLITNILSMHTKILVFSERAHFFRFIYNRCGDLSERDVAMMLHQQNVRLRHRYKIEIDVESILENILKKEISYPVIYDELMKFFMRKEKKEIWIEYAAMHWDGIPRFLNFFKEGKAAHIIRDPRAVLASWKKLSSLPENVYLNCIFNWLDSAQSMSQFKEILPSDRYLDLRYEDIHSDPENAVKRMCEYIGVTFEEDMIRGDTWEGKYDRRIVAIPRSAHDGNNITGFSEKRVRNWEKNLEEWEICLTETLLGAEMEKLGYQPFKEKYETQLVRKGFDILCKSPFLLKQLIQYFSSGTGTNQYPTDPTDPQSWGAPDNPSEWFLDSPESAAYFRDLEAVEHLMAKLYKQ